MVLTDPHISPRQSFWLLLVSDVCLRSPTAECALGVHFLGWRWVLVGFLWLPLGLRQFSLYTVSSMLYVSTHAFLQLPYNLEPLVIPNQQARPQSDQRCSWYRCLKIEGWFLVGCESVHHVMIDVKVVA